MNDLAVTPDDLDQAAGVCLTEADVALDALTQFKGYIQNLQDMYQPVPPDVFANILTDLDTYTRQYHDSLSGIGSGLRKNYINYADVERLNTSLLAIDGYTPVTSIPDINLLRPAHLRQAVAAPQ